ncbi:MAG: hypothetical protein ACOY3J_05330 [Bacillota bacterium]|uniref:Uncharacterized protein n=1 Tax=Thermanaerosceptrum fracticalcis TaxID=1712410 RepID=A0A7G6E3G9_THEFR|nr:hypothetical protein [Thermanaerosceptrum fracticalcis]QNB46623.1 hypothetical protein BR63_10085 [Thermanaerosceptrum fracticalcis]
MKKIGIKYCGNCNPHIDSPAIINYLKEHSKGEWEFVSWNDNEMALLIIMSGCPADCATRPDFQGKVISVSGLYVDLHPVEEKVLKETLLKKVYETLNKTE